MKGKNHKVAANLNALLVREQHWMPNNRETMARQDLTTVTNALTGPAVIAAVLNAIDEGDEETFLKTCTGANISVDIAQRVWDATMGSLDPQAAKPCW